MARLNIPIKQTGDPNNPTPNTTLSAAEVNAISPSVNSLYDSIDGVLSAGSRGVFKTTDAAPNNPIENQYFDLIGNGTNSGLSGTYTNLLTAPATPLVIPAPTSGYSITNARAYYKGGYWLPKWQEVAVAPDYALKTDLNGSLTVAGVTNQSTGYTLTTTSEYSRVVRSNPVQNSGYVTQFNAKVFKAGELHLVIWRSSGGLNYKVVSKVIVTATTGDNVFVMPDASIEVVAGDLVGFTTPTGGATLYYKQPVTNGGFLSTDNTVAVGDVLAMSTSNSEFAISATVQQYSLRQSTDQLQETSLKTDASVLVDSTNLASPANQIQGLYITANTGFKVTTGASGWVTYRVPVPADATSMTFGGFNITTGGYSAFYTSADTPIAGGANIAQYNGLHTTDVLPVTVNVPDTAKGGWLYVSVARPTDTADKYAKTFINVGDVALGYEVPGKRIESTTVDGQVYHYASPQQPANSSSGYINADRLEYRSTRKAIFSFEFDDINASDANVKAIFESYGFKPSFALKTSNLTPSNGKQYLNYWKDGCSILAHSVTHPNMSSTSISHDAVKAEMINSKKAITDLGIIVSGWVTPESVLNPLFYDLVDQIFGYSHVFASGVGNYDTTVAPNRMSRYSIEQNDVATIQSFIDNAIANTKLVIFYAHTLPAAQLDETKLRAILAYLQTKANNFECMVLNSDDAVKTYYTPTYAEKFS